MGLMPPVSNSPVLGENDIESLMKRAQELIARKDKLEEELRELEDVLINAGVGMDTPLVDNQGFPRSEIDVHTIRTSRNRIIRLRNDHRDIMADIESILHQIHEAKRLNQSSEPSTSTTTSSTTQPEAMDTTDDIQSERLVPYAVVNAVAPDSPAYTAGLRRNDHILQFGHVNASNNERLQALNLLIGRNENQRLPVKVLRDGQTLDLTVTPRSGWGGRGTLGCHLLPL